MAKSTFDEAVSSEDVFADARRRYQSQSAQPNTSATGDRASDPQIKFIRDLRDKRKLDALTAEQRLWLEADDFTKLSKRKASGIIDLLKKQPWKPRENDNEVKFPEVVSGRYAVDNNDGELRFYKVNRGKTGKFWVRVLFGPSEAELPYKTALAILQKIADAGPREAAVRFGHEIGACSNCGRRLTNRVSRELGIGPICGGRFYADEWDSVVSIARQAIVDRGEDPDEKLD